MTCVHCGADVREAALAHDAERQRRAAVMADLEQRLQGLGATRAMQVPPSTNSDPKPTTAGL